MRDSVIVVSLCIKQSGDQPAKSPRLLRLAVAHCLVCSSAPRKHTTIIGLINRQILDNTGRQDPKIVRIKWAIFYPPTSRPKLAILKDSIDHALSSRAALLKKVK